MKTKSLILKPYGQIFFVKIYRQVSCKRKTKVLRDIQALGRVRLISSQALCPFLWKVAGVYLVGYLRCFQ